MNKMSLITYSELILNDNAKKGCRSTKVFYKKFLTTNFLIMKIKILPVIISAALTGYFIHANAQANKSLSNLTSPTAVNQSLIPNQANNRDLGSPTRPWRNLYLANAIYIGPNRFIAIPFSAASIAIGFLSLANTTGNLNTAIGYQALTAATTGSGNTVFLVVK